MQETSNPDKLIGCLAVLQSGLIEKDFISSYLPLVATVLQDNQEDTVKIELVMEDFKNRYGFTIDRAPMTRILDICVKRGIVSLCKGGYYVIHHEKCLDYSISDKVLRDKKDEYNSVVYALVDFYKEKYQISISKDAAEENFLLFLDDNSAKTLTLSFDYVEEDAYSPRQHSYIISKFIKYCEEEQPHIFNLIQNLALAFLMSCAIAYDGLDKTAQIQGYENLVLYLDTPLVLRILGLNEQAMQDADLAMMEQLRQMHATFKIFGHTYDEIEGIINDCIHWIDNPNYKESLASLALRNFVSRNFTKSQIEVYRDTLSLKLKEYGITVDDNDYYTGKYYQYQEDDQKIQECIIEEYKKHNPNFDVNQKEHTIDNDVKSISSILKLWERKPARTYRQAKYVFVTTNSTLAYITRQFTQEQNPNAKYRIYPCITNVFLGTNIWLGAPVKKLKDFSTKKLMADCMSIIQPSGELLCKVQDAIEKYRNDASITEEQYYWLRIMAFSNDYIVEWTLNDENLFTDENADELIQRIENEITKPYRDELENLKKEIDEEREKRELSEEKNRQHEDEKRRKEEEDGRLKIKAGHEMNIIENIVLGMILVDGLGIVGIILSIISSEMVLYILLIAVLILLLLFRIFLWLDFCGIKRKITFQIYKYLKKKEYGKTL